MADPAGVLGRIAAAKREELARRFDGVTLAALRESALAANNVIAN